MVDITMCQNSECGSSWSCYRYLAKPGKHQSYAAFKPDEDTYCKDYIKQYGTSPDDATQTKLNVKKGSDDAS